MTTHQDREADAAQRLLDAVERLTGERAGHLYQRDTGAVYTRMAELIEREVVRRDELAHGAPAEVRRLTNGVAADMATILQHATVPLGDTADAAVDRLIAVDAIAAQMQAQLAAVVAYARMLEDRYAAKSRVDRMRIEAGVQRIMEASDGE